MDVVYVSHYDGGGGEVLMADTLCECRFEIKSIGINIYFPLTTI